MKVSIYIKYIAVIILLLGVLGYQNRENFANWGEIKAKKLIEAGNEVSHRRSEWDRAYKYYSIAILIGKKNDDWAYNCRGLISWKRFRRWRNINDFNKALSDFDKALELSPDYSAVMYNKSLLYQTKGENETALSFCEQAIQNDPHYRNSYELKTELLFDMGRYTEAIAFGKEAIEKIGDNSDIYFDIAYSYEMMGDYKRAIEYYDKELKISDYQSWWTFTNASYCKLMLGDYKGAIDYAENSIKLNENNIHPYNFIAFAALQTGNYELAEKYTNYAFNIKDKSDYLTYYNYAQIKVLKGDIAGAKTRLEKARTLFEKDTNTWKFDGFEELCDKLEARL